MKSNKSLFAPVRTSVLGYRRPSSEMKSNGSGSRPRHAALMRSWACDKQLSSSGKAQNSVLSVQSDSGISDSLCSTGASDSGSSTRSRPWTSCCTALLAAADILRKSVSSSSGCARGSKNNPVTS